MTTTVWRGDDTLPLAVTWRYKITPGVSSGGWVEIESLSRTHVEVTGVEETIADWRIRKRQFDDLITAYQIRGWFLLTETTGFELGTEDGNRLVWS